MLREPELLEMRRVDSVTWSFPFIFFKNILFQHKAHFPKEVPGGEIPESDYVLWEHSHLCNFGFSSWICPLQLLQVPWEEKRTGGSITWPKPPWGPRLAGQWAPALTQLAPLLAHASYPPPLRRHIQRTTHLSCTGNLEERIEASWVQKARGREQTPPPGTIKKPFYKTSICTCFSAFPSMMSLHLSPLSNSVKHIR